ncbi:hypothetical protein J2Z21_007967 [Streptomyces griseochromogenes]|uniref:Uncharacterized protein n=1 Tax=Streptomyces griseochromogenes TaxID=68214 RepID=A0ABS4M5K2_9ACTN|nr:hypothetical protein [Streptomyces griseochromogenes]
MHRHTAGEGRDGHGGHKRCDGRRSMHPGNSAGSAAALAPCTGGRLTRRGDPVPPAGASRVSRVTHSGASAVFRCPASPPAAPAAPCAPPPGSAPRH